MMLECWDARVSCSASENFLLCRQCFLPSRSDRIATVHCKMLTNVKVIRSEYQSPYTVLFSDNNYLECFINHELELYLYFFLKISSLIPE